MSLLAPLALVLGAATAAAVVALHLLTTRRPPPLLLPTARFVPEGEARAVARASRPTDLVLLALRVLAVLLAALAFARPVLDAPGPSVRTVVLLDVSRAVADPAAAAAQAQALAADGGAVVAFGATAREVPVDSIGALGVDAEPGAATAAVDGAARAARGSLSAGLVAARRAAARIARGADSVRLVVVSPIPEGSVDAATAGFRAAWPGRIEIERVAATADTARATRPQLVTPLADDPLAPALDALPQGRGAHPVRIARGPATTADSAWAREAGRVLLAWPAEANRAAEPLGVTTLGPRPTALVAPFIRLPLADTGGAVLARWNDGAPAVLERPLGAGCVREVGVGLPLAGDLTLRAPFAHFLAAMVEPCGGRRGAPIPESELGWLAGEGPLAPAGTLAAGEGAGAERLSAWLLVGALLLLLVEQIVRARHRRAAGATRATSESRPAVTRRAA